MKKAFFLVLFIVSTITCFAQSTVNARPKLVVAIVVDELNSDQLFTWQKKFEKGGFARMMNQGTFIPHLRVTTTSSYYGTSVASLYSGATPAIHGIISNNWENRFDQKKMNALYGDQDLEQPDSALTISCN